MKPCIAVFEKPDKPLKSVITSFTFCPCGDSGVPDVYKRQVDDDGGGAGTPFGRENESSRRLDTKKGGGVTKYQVQSAFSTKNILNSDNSH